MTSPRRPQDGSGVSSSGSLSRKTSSTLRISSAGGAGSTGIAATGAGRGGAGARRGLGRGRALAFVGRLGRFFVLVARVVRRRIDRFAGRFLARALRFFPRAAPRFAARPLAFFFAFRRRVAIDHRLPFAPWRIVRSAGC
jgi:hypothetical protein